MSWVRSSRLAQHRRNGEQRLVYVVGLKAHEHGRDHATEDDDQSDKTEQYQKSVRAERDRAQHDRQAEHRSGDGTSGPGLRRWVGKCAHVPVFRV
jgi:hypothetical protein